MLCVQGTVSDMMLDVSTAISWVLDNCEQYGGDPSNVTLVGQSAGAHLNMMCMTMNLVNARENSAKVFKGSMVKMPFEGVGGGTNRFLHVPGKTANTTATFGPVHAVGHSCPPCGAFRVPPVPTHERCSVPSGRLSVSAASLTCLGR